MEEQIQYIKLDQLVDSPYQGRFEGSAQEGEAVAEPREATELAQSIGASGLLQPIIVRKVGDHFEIIDGHRRVKACRQLGKTEVQAVVREADDREAQIISVVTNLQRKNLSLTELAVAYKKMLDHRLFADNRELSKALGKDETYVGNVLSMLKMDSRILEDLITSDTVRDVKILRMIRRHSPAVVEGKSDKQWTLYKKVRDEKMTRRMLEEYLKEKTPSDSPRKWSISEATRSFTLRFDTKSLTEEQKQLLIKTLGEKIAELGW